MPGWHALTQSLERNGRLKVVGLIQEQHPDRCRLFMQWHQMDWPILVDSLNELDIRAVPITVFLDEYGIVRFINPSHESLQTFIQTKYDKPEGWTPTKTSAPKPESLPISTLSSRDEDWRRYGTWLLKWGGESKITEAIEALQRAWTLNEREPRNAFRLGVAYRKRFESAYGQSEDFAHAIQSWTAALELDPNQYIWRRRIQQYGPRLDKPYSFYDWVFEARRDIVQRGETPFALSVEPSGAEFAQPGRALSNGDATHQSPDPEGRIHRDHEQLIQVELVVVRSTDPVQKAVRVHLRFTPNAALQAHWNNEVDDLVVWVDSAQGWTLDAQHHQTPGPPETIDDQTRVIEFEARLSGSDPVSGVLSGYALYYVCEGVNGVCLYRRQDFAVSMEAFLKKD